MPRRALRVVGWVALVAVVDLIARAFAYALARPSDSLHAQLAGKFGGPTPVVLSLAMAATALAVSAGVLALAEMGVRERWALADRATRGPRPRIRLRTVLLRAVVVWTCGLLVFTLVESYIHWRAGLGFHGIACLTGPVHRNVIPIIGALALIASAAVSGVAHLLRWMRRVVALLLGGRRRTARRPRIARPRRVQPPLPNAPLLEALRARPPPLHSATC